jgi:predicted alpha/beta-fold hydrolase
MGNDFKSPWWLPDRHSQTLWRRFSPVASVSRTRQRITIADGDFIDLDHLAGLDQTRASQRPQVLLLHGLCGSADSGYIQSTQQILQASDYDTVAMNFRGCSGEINRLARAYHSGATEDLVEVIAALQNTAQRPIILVGFSLGANVTLRYLFEQAEHTPVVKAVAVSTPFGLAECSATLSKGLSSAYGLYFKRQLIQGVNDKKAHFRATNNPQELARLESLGDLRRIQSLWDFDDKVTAPLHGFANADDYYRRCSSGSVLSQITCPVRLIQSLNDPFIPPAVLPRREALPTHIELQQCAQGGHVGFVSSTDRLWLERQILGAIDGVGF